jgi:MoxR-like ATPase
VKPPIPIPPGKYEDLYKTTFLPPEFFADFEQLLKTKKQVILQGAPGTGKTFVARQVARFWAEPADGVEIIQISFMESSRSSKLALRDSALNVACSSIIASECGIAKKSTS